MLHLDDPLDAIAVHAWNGTWGLIAPGFFSTKIYIQVCPSAPSSSSGSPILCLIGSVFCLLAPDRGRNRESHETVSARPSNA